MWSSSFLSGYRSGCSFHLLRSRFVVLTRNILFVYFKFVRFYAWSFLVDLGVSLGDDADRLQFTKR